MDRIKPCPFCGEEVYLEQKPLWNGSHGYVGDYEFVIECHNCGCTINYSKNNTVYNSEYEARDNVIKAWNRRSNND